MVAPPRPDSTPERVTHHMTAFNDAVDSDNFDDFVGRFADDAVMSFVGVPVGPFVGREAILAGYTAAPPDDTMAPTSVQTNGATDIVRFVWSRGGAGTMTLRWRGEQLTELTVAFDPS